MRRQAVCERFEVVYVGKATAKRAASGGAYDLGARLMLYVNTGSHKHAQIDEVLGWGQSLWFRFRTAGSAAEAEQLETRLLRRYDYAWNVMEQGHIVGASGGIRQPTRPKHR